MLLLTARQLASKILLVIDISGSMCSDLESVKAAVRYMLNNGITKPDVIVYHTTARRCTAEEMLAMRVDGGTSFEAALDKIVEYVGACRPGEKLAAIFMCVSCDEMLCCVFFTTSILSLLN
jgi:Mg-chelatase subunit ChlD